MSDERRIAKIKAVGKTESANHIRCLPSWTIGPFTGCEISGEVNKIIFLLCLPISEVRLAAL